MKKALDIIYIGLNVATIILSVVCIVLCLKGNDEQAEDNE